MEPCDTPYSLDFRSFIIDGCKLSSVTEIAFEQIKSYSSDPAMVQFGKKHIIIGSVKGFLQIYEDTTGKVAIVKSISYNFCEAEYDQLNNYFGRQIDRKAVLYFF